jgi:hypothetical protein
MLEHARKDTACIPGDDPHYAAGCLLARFRDAKRIELYEQFAGSDEVDLAYHIGPEGEEGAYLYFSLA